MAAVGMRDRHGRLSTTTDHLGFVVTVRQIRDPNARRVKAGRPSRRPPRGAPYLLEEAVNVFFTAWRKTMQSCKRQLFLDFDDALGRVDGSPPAAQQYAPSTLQQSVRRGDPSDS
jgi:hypothetical protein